MKTIIRAYVIFTVVTIICACGYEYVDNVHADSPSMKIHSLYLPSSEVIKSWGSPTLIESRGSFLLVDGTRHIGASDIVSYLKRKNIRKLDLMVTHYHTYAYESHEEIIKDPYFTVNTIYLPDNKYSSDFPYNDTEFQHVRKSAKDIAVRYDVDIKYTVIGDRIPIGDAELKVIGPVEGNSFSYYSTKYGVKAAYNYYVNNSSLVSMITCGKRRFLLPGDLLKDGENALIKKYGKSFLKADIYQMAHHGLGSSSEAFVNSVSPTFSFGCNNFFNYRYPSGKRCTHDQQRWASNFGLYYMVGDEKKDLVISVTNSKVIYYKNGKALTGWVTLQGGDKNKYRTTDKYYINSATGKPLTGIKKLGGKYYDFGNGGCVKFAAYDKNGQYKYWDGNGKKIRYYTQSGERYVGVKTIEKRLFYVNSSGYKKLGNIDFTPVKIGKKKYLIALDGDIYTKGWKRYKNGKKRFVTQKGVMVTGWKKIGKKKYFFDKKTGYLKKEKSK